MSFQCIDDNEDNEFCFFYYDTLNENLALFIPFSIVFIFFSFYFMALIADSALSPSLAKITQKINISQTLAGATLLAFANGGNDVIAAFTAGGTTQGVPLVIGSIMGAGLFDFTLCTAVVVLTAKNVKVVKNCFVRDVSFYMIGTVYLLILGLIGEITMVGILGFFVIYFIYILFIMAMEKQSKKEEHALRVCVKVYNEQHIPIEHEGFSQKSFIKSKRGSFAVISGNRSRSQSKTLSELVSANPELISDPEIQVHPSHVGHLQHKSHFHPDLSSQEEEHQIDKNALHEKLLAVNMNMNHEDDYGCHVKDSIAMDPDRSFEEETGFSKILTYLNVPLEFLCNLTAPAIDEEHWNKSLALIQPFGALLIFLAGNELLDAYIGKVWVGYILLPIACVFSILIFAKTKSDKMHSYPTVASLITLIVAISWLEFISIYVVDYLQFVGSLTGLAPTFIGMTILAMGNTLGDIMANRALAKMGFGVTAITACFAGPLFNYLIGLAASYSRQIFVYGDIDFDLFNFSSENIADGCIFELGVLFAVLLSLIANLAYGYSTGFHLKGSYAKFMLGFYVVVMFSFTIYALYLRSSS